MKKAGKIAIVPGSFDPMTLGHRALVEEAAKRYETVYVAVMENADKKTVLDVETKQKIADLTLAGIPNVKVISDGGLLINLFDRLGADAVCKGYRNETDLAYEKMQDEWNRAHNPRFCTALFKAKAGTENISSTKVRKLLKEGGSLSGLVAEPAIPILNAAMAKKK